jgi:Pectate lyase superfamily protein
MTVPYTFGTQTGPIPLSELDANFALCQTVTPQTSAEAAAGITPNNLNYPVGNVLRYGADPTGTTDSTQAIQNSILVVTQTGGVVFVPAGNFKISSTITLRPNVTVEGAGCGDSSTIGETSHRVTMFQPTSSFTGNDIFRADPADFGTDVYCRGVCLSNFMIDMYNLGATSKNAIRLNSVSDLPTFDNLRVWNINAGSAIRVGVSSNSGALLSDGLVFSNFVCLTYGIDVYSGSMVILEDCNEITFRDGKILSRSNGAPVSGSIGVEIRSTNIGVNGITFDATSFGGFESCIKSTATGGGQGARWVRVQNCTFEVWKYGVYASGTVSLASQFWTIVGNKFISAVAGGANIALDYASNNVVVADDYYTTTNVLLTANSSSNQIWAQSVGVNNLNANNLIFGHSTSNSQFQTSGLYRQPTQTPTLLNSWSNGAPATRTSAGYWKDQQGVVHLQGYLSGGTFGSGSGNIIFTLPSGYYPVNGSTFAVATGGGYGLVVIDASGNIYPVSGSGYVSLDGINFPTF